MITGIYEETLADIETSIGIVPRCLRRLSKKTLIQFWPFLKEYQLGESKMPEKYRELINLSAIFMTKSSSSLFMSIKLAMRAGATNDEIAEALFLADHADRWGGMYHTLYYDQITLEDKVSDYYPKKKSPRSSAVSTGGKDERRLGSR